MSRLLEMWLQDAQRDRRRRAWQACRAVDLLKDKSTQYASDMRALGQAHHDAANVYAIALYHARLRDDGAPGATPAAKVTE